MTRSEFLHLGKPSEEHQPYGSFEVMHIPIHVYGTLLNAGQTELTRVPGNLEGGLQTIISEITT